LFPWQSFAVKFDAVCPLRLIAVRMSIAESRICFMVVGFGD
jgi:hypothetical protein